MREARVVRETLETRVDVWLSLDGRGSVEVSTGLGFFDHMLETMLFYAGYDSSIRAVEKKSVGGHHVIEDTGITLGEAVRKALGDRYARFGYSITPMDESLALVAVDISGRPRFNVDIPKGTVGGVALEDLAHFIEALASSLKASIHVVMVRTGNRHHDVEAVFKALGFALGQATRVSDRLVTTKGIL
ncbi:MAG: imidazoleglycerol-phosphate dehydratase [Desulfurococcales archaeon]|nr:imidazoleglycerol-phosphate dehydratase [Desulfurococcales archaeon]